jgi:anti-anti-sigma factor
MRYELRERDLLVVHADAQLGQASPEAFLERMLEFRERGVRRVVVDCTGIDYLGTPGICALVQVHHWMHKRGGVMKLCGLRPLVADVFLITHLDRLFEIYPDLAAALGSFQQPVQA